MQNKHTCYSARPSVVVTVNFVLDARQRNNLPASFTPATDIMMLLSPQFRMGFCCSLSCLSLSLLCYVSHFGKLISLLISFSLFIILLGLLKQRIQHFMHFFWMSCTRNCKRIRNIIVYEQDDFSKPINSYHSIQSYSNSPRNLRDLSLSARQKKSIYIKFQEGCIPYCYSSDTRAPPTCIHDLSLTKRLG